MPDGRQCACGNRGCLEAHFSGAALARDATEAAEQGQSAELANRLEANGGLSAADVAAAAAAGDATALDLIRRAAAAPARSSPDWSVSSTRDWW